jgi:hypothetical protein
MAKLPIQIWIFSFVHCGCLMGLRVVSQEGKTKHWVAVVFNKICKDKGAISTTLVSHNIRSQFFNQFFHGRAHL